MQYSREVLAGMFNKSPRAISRWINQYETKGSFQRASSDPKSTFTANHRRWMLSFYQSNPLAYLDEAQAAFIAAL
jgi:transposase